MDIIRNVWFIPIHGSPMYTLSCRIGLADKRLKHWCLDRRLFWGINWKQLMSHLHDQSTSVTSIHMKNSNMTQRRSLILETRLAHDYWTQRVKEHKIQLADLPSKYLFNRMKQRQVHNMLYILRNKDGDWVDTPTDIADIVLHHCSDIFKVSYLQDLFNTANGEAILT